MLKVKIVLVEIPLTVVKCRGMLSAAAASQDAEIMILFAQD